MAGRRVFGDRFEPFEQISSSPTLWVFHAEDRATRRQVVLEVFAPGVGDPSAEFRRRFEKALRAGVGIDHANAGSPVGAGFDHGSYFVATDVPEGRTLAEAIGATAPLSSRRVAEIALEISEALAAAHSVGIAHGNLTVDAVIEAHDDGRLVVCGFGQAYVLGAHDDPGEPPTTSGDLSDLGALLVACLAGATPSAGLESVIGRLEAVGTEDGYASAAALRSDLDRLVGVNEEADGVAPPHTGPGLVRSLPWALKALVALLAVGALAGGAIFLADRLDFRLGDAPEADVPDVAGVSQDLAIERLGAVGLDHAVQSQQSSEVDEGEVIEQIPDPGSTLREGDTVTLVVSTGGVPVRVPEVIGMQEAEARAALEAANLVVLVVADTWIGFTSGQVVNQSPGGGNDADEGDTVTITVAP